MKVAALDIGTNSLHMVVAEVHGDGSFAVVDQVKDMVRIGDGSIGTRHLAPAAMERGLEALARCRRLADSHGVDALVAYATSAVREADNGGDFIQRAKLEAGVAVQVISGVEEGRLIFTAVRHALDLSRTPALVVDIGGGSVEFILGDGPSGATFVRSVKLGTARMSEAFVSSDPISAADLARLRRHYDAVLAPIFAHVTGHFEQLIGSSGTLETLAVLAHARRDGTVPTALNGLRVDREALGELNAWLIRSDAAARRKLAGLDEKRVDLIVAGSVLLDTILEATGADGLTISEFALREGMILDYLSTHLQQCDLYDRYTDARRRSVFELARRCDWVERHSRQVARLALMLFDGTAPLHGLGPVERDLLEYAAYLHDIGHHIGHSGHHKHTQYLIEHGELKGFSPAEIQTVAHVARYHRKAPPKSSHATFADLPKAQRETIRTLAALLRVADALDRSRFSNVESLTVTVTDETLDVALTTSGEPELELWAVGHKRDLFDEVFDRTLRVTARPTGRLTESPMPVAETEP